jgi:hypothetical protein
MLIKMKGPWALAVILVGAGLASSALTQPTELRSSTGSFTIMPKAGSKKDKLNKGFFSGKGNGYAKETFEVKIYPEPGTGVPDPEGSGNYVYGIYFQVVTKRINIGNDCEGGTPLCDQSIQRILEWQYVYGPPTGDPFRADFMDTFCHYQSGKGCSISVTTLPYFYPIGAAG